MNANFRIENPDKLDASMSITMSVKEWKELANQIKCLNQEWPVSDLFLKITDLISKCETVFYNWD